MVRKAKSGVITFTAVADDQGGSTLLTVLGVAAAHVSQLYFADELFAATERFTRKQDETDDTVAKLTAAVDPQSIDTEYLDSARAAVSQAATVVQRNHLQGSPRIMMSDDGVLTLQWRNENQGVALIFTGDGTVSVALKNAQQIYSDSLQDDLSINEPLPGGFFAALNAIVT